jgi:hypothetical protein
VSDRELACDDPVGIIASPQQTADKQYGVIDQCIHKWGARFALAPGSNSEIAKAAVYRCEEAVADYNLLRIREKNPISDAERSGLNEELFNMALMRVVQERSGQCPLEQKKR